MKAELSLALRYMKPRTSEVSVIGVLSVLGVTLGVTVLVIVLAVMTGFIGLFKEKLIETQAHVQIYRPNGLITNTRPVIERLEAVGGSGAGVITNPALVQDDHNRFVPKMVIGIDPEALAGHYNAEALIRGGRLSLEPGEIMISTAVAAEFGVGVGGKLLVHSPRRLAQLVKVGEDGGVSLNDTGEVFLPHEYTVSGIFSFGKSDFDRQFVFIGSDDAAELYGYPWGAATAVFGWLPDPYDMSQELGELRRSLRQANYPYLRVESWEESNMTLLGVLDVEKRMMFFLLIFIILVAAFSITNTLITSVYQKTREIGVLKALGAGNFQIMRIFIWQGLMVGVLGAGLGCALGCLLLHYRNQVLGWLRERGTDPFPKEFYYFNELPAKLVASDLLLVAGCAILLCALGAVLPAWRASRLDPAKALRYE